jgi:hypothetical protein
MHPVPASSSRPRLRRRHSKPNTQKACNGSKQDMSNLAEETAYRHSPSSPERPGRGQADNLSHERASSIRLRSSASSRSASHQNRQFGLIRRAGLE